MNILLELSIVSIAIGLASQLSYFLIADRKKIKELRNLTNELSRKFKEAKDENEKNQIYMEMLKHSSELMKESLKPTLYTFIPFVLVFYFISQAFSYYPITNGSVLFLSNSTPIQFSNCIYKQSHGEYILNYTNSCTIYYANSTFQLSSLYGSNRVIVNKYIKISPQEVGISTPFGFVNWFIIYFILTFLSSYIFSLIFERLGF